VTRALSLNNCHDQIDFQADFVADLSKDTGYPADAIKARELYHQWIQEKNENIITYRDQTHASIYTGTMSPKLGTAWWEAFDDSVIAFTSV
jgi:trimethylamine monooxygenase